ncbi:MAG: hypothetical protein ACYC2H_06160 [Thermoplasmatota archaeon]
MTRTTIALDTATRDHLKRFGTHGDTYDQILSRLMGEAERHGFYEEVRRIQANHAAVQWKGHDETWDGL